MVSLRLGGRPVLAGSGVLSMLLLVFTIGRDGVAAPRVQFDVRDVLACRDVTPAEGARDDRAATGERIVEAVFQVSSLVPDDAKADAIQLLYRIESTRRSMRVEDYEPKTTMRSEYAGNVSIQKHSDTNASAHAKIHAAYPLVADAQAEGDYRATSKVDIRYEMLPPLEVLAAAGTVDRGAGVYFKLKSSPQGSLEGARDLVVRFRVPAKWRADVVRVTCQVLDARRGLSRALPHEDDDNVSRFVVALHAEGDEEARRTARALVQIEQRLRQMARDSESTVHKVQFPSPAHQLGAILSVYEPRLPETWLDQLVFGSDPAVTACVLRQLPPSLGPTARAYITARTRLARLKRDE